MWILPKQLHTSDFVPDMEGLNLDSTELSEICARSLFARSKPSPARTWLLKWKRDLWSQHLSGRILNPSHGQSFVTAWTSSLAATHASHSRQPGSASEPKTLATSGHLSQTEFGFCDPSSASLKMSKDTSASASERSLEIWNKLVTQRRGEFSARLKSALRTRESGSSSWPTARVTTNGGNSNAAVRNGTSKRDWKRDCRLEDYVVMHGQAAPANHNMDGSRQGLWPSARPSGSGTHNAMSMKNAWSRIQKTGYRSNLEEALALQHGPSPAKLNPRWVEALMGLPVGWVMPSCASPVTIALTSCDSSATESCLPPQSERSAF